MLTSIQMRNFKAIRASGAVGLKPFTVFIGDNGSGKSSLFEGLRFYQSVVQDGLPKTFRNLGISPEGIFNKFVLDSAEVKDSKTIASDCPMQFVFAAKINGAATRWNMSLATCLDLDNTEIIGEEILWKKNNTYLSRASNAKGAALVNVDKKTKTNRQVIKRLPVDSSYIEEASQKKIATQLHSYISKWQFVFLEPNKLGTPTLQVPGKNKVSLAQQGDNIASYLLDIKKRDEDAFETILQLLQIIVPYIEDLQPTFTQELKNQVYLNMSEGNQKIPGWLLSMGTLRLIALVALLHDPEPPPLIVIEELENGLDPRSVSLIINQIRYVTAYRRTQVIATTHSPYLLDKMELPEIVVTERDSKNRPIFWSPAEEKSLIQWAKKFSSGSLYTTGKIRKENV